MHVESKYFVLTELKTVMQQLRWKIYLHHRLVEIKYLRLFSRNGSYRDYVLRQMIDVNKSVFY